MKKNQDNFPCICGHTYTQHDWQGWNNICWADSGIDVSCFCKKYVPDNLKYLEAKYEQNL